MDVETDHVFTLDRYAAHEFTCRLYLAIPAAVEHIDPAVDKAISFVHSHACIDDEVEFELRVALHEAIANAVLHGCKRDDGKQVHCLVGCHDGKLLMIVRDPGNGFDPGKVPCPTDDDRLFEDHGRGVELMRQLMDEVRFERGGAEVHLIKRYNGCNAAGQPQ